MNQEAKDYIMRLINVIPYGRDLYLAAFKNRKSISYRGKFSNYIECKQSTSNKTDNNYDNINANKAKNIEGAMKGLDTWFFHTDYPLLFWLSNLIKENSSILELGGSIGHHYYTFSNFIRYPESLNWTIAELKNAVDLGQKIAQKHNALNLEFVNSNKLPELEPAEIFLSSGTLQYIPDPLEQIIKSLKKQPIHILLHNIPTHSDTGIWTLQKLKNCEVPYQIFSKKELILNMEDLGYRLVESWTTDRSIEIPFHLNYKIEGYLGYYFTSENN